MDKHKRTQNKSETQKQMSRQQSVIIWSIA